jgi:hypothetical protein
VRPIGWLVNSYNGKDISSCESATTGDVEGLRLMESNNVHLLPRRSIRTLLGFLLHSSQTATTPAIAKMPSGRPTANPTVPDVPRPDDPFCTVTVLVEEGGLEDAVKESTLAYSFGRTLRAHISKASKGNRSGGVLYYQRAN